MTFRREPHYCTLPQWKLLIAVGILFLFFAGTVGCTNTDSSDFAARKSFNEDGWSTRISDKPIHEKLSLPVHPEAMSAPKSKREHPKVFFIGFDGITWKVLEPLMNQGRLPNIKKLCSTGSYGWLQTDIGLSPVSWTSIMTGTGSQQHGFSKNPKDDLDIWTKVNSGYRKIYYIWDLLDARGWTVGLGFYPFMSPELLSKSILTPANIGLPEGDRPEFQLLNGNHTYQTSFLQKAPADFLVTLFQFTDRIQHHSYSQYLLANYYGEDAFTGTDSKVELIRKEGKEVDQAYEMMDMIVGKVLDSSPDYILIMSDHGFSTAETTFTVTFTAEFFKALGLKLPVDHPLQNTLIEMGLQALKLEGSDRTPCNVSVRFGWNDYRWVELGDGQKVKVRLCAPSLRFEYDTMFPPGSFKKVQKNARNMKCGDLPCLKVKANRKVLEVAPSDEIAKAVMAGHQQWSVFETTAFTGNHGPTDPGVFIITGPGVKAGHQIESAQVFDIVPTLMYLVGEPVAKDLDGRILFDAVEPKFREVHPEHYVETYGRPKFTMGKPKELTHEEKNKLKSLGYIN